MKINKSVLLISLTVAFSFLVLFIIGCSGAIEMQSGFNKSDIKIDGDNSDWQGPYFNLEDEKMLVKIVNDDKYLYLCLIAIERQRGFQLLSLGLTLWFDNTGGKKETFGIHFPIGAEGGMNPMRMIRNPDASGLNANEKERQENEINMMKESLREIEILGPKKEDREIIPIERLKGILVGMRSIERSLVYEIRVPLKTDDNNRYGINADMTKPIGIGIVSGKFKMETGQGMGMSPGGGDGGGMPGGGRSGGRSGGGGGRQRGGAGNETERRDQLSQLDIWLKINLANK